jgi:hypothetical protein
MTDSDDASSRFRRGSAPLATKIGMTVDEDPHGIIHQSSARGLADLLARGDAFGFLARWFAKFVSDVNRREAREVGEFAVISAEFFAASGNNVTPAYLDYLRHCSAATSQSPRGCVTAPSPRCSIRRS